MWNYFPILPKSDEASSPPRPPIPPLLFSSLSIGTHICSIEHMWRREESLWEPVPFFHCAGPQDQTQVISLGGRHLSWPSHLSKPHQTFSMQLNCVFQLQKILIHFKYGFCLINFLFSLWLDVHTVLWTHVLFFQMFDLLLDALHLDSLFKPIFVERKCHEDKDQDCSTCCYSSSSEQNT